MNRNDRIDYFNNIILPGIKRTFSKEGIKRLWNKSYFTGILLILIGLLFIFLPLIISGSIGVIFGLLMVSIGVTTLFDIFAYKNNYGRGYKIVKAIFFIVMGAYFIIFPLLLMSFLTVVIGIFFFIEGFIKIRGMLAVPYRKSISWWVNFILSGIVGGMGLFIALYPFKGTEAIIIISGVVIVISGIQKIFDSWRQRHICN